LAVPRYADAVASDTDDDEPVDSRKKQSVLVNSKAAWRKQVAKWQKESRELDELSEDDTEVPEPPTGQRRRRWLPVSLDTLFGGKTANPIRIRRQAFTEESLHMELLAAEHSDEAPDDGELEGSGDDYEG
jgi:hypothetical protein